MSDMELINPLRSALLILHYQADVFTILFGESRPEILDRANSVIGQWRSRERPVIFANFALGNNYQMANSDNYLLNNLVETGLFKQPTPVSGLDIRPGDPIYSCPRVNVFRDTSLDADLRAQGVDTLIIAGITTTGVIFSSIGYASDADYKLYLLKDCCFDPDHEAHESLFRTSLRTRSFII